MRYYFLLVLLVVSGCTSNFNDFVFNLDKMPITYDSQDGCNLDCWYNLRIGESSSKDVLDILQSNKDIWYWNIDNDSTENNNQIIDGYYTIDWNSHPPVLGAATLITQFIIRESILQEIRLVPEIAHNLKHMANLYGSPDHIFMRRFAFGGPIGQLFISLFYDDLNVYISLTAFQEHCQMNTFSTDFVTEQIFYLNDEVYANTKQFFSDEDYIVPVSDEVLTQWLNAQSTDDCWEFLSTYEESEK